ncbi:uncharacterized protein LOC126465926 [Schistocerca serialis cubense]|uniref:uncharacterized protein LOC126465926 n=1 Tax=Schistocerca serialis cubense TaxID=2023355 RepID=UPI00214EA186|nr:uncharacterized protein LOC126465926 [Schistocerca serialis cubense]XP_049952301.1 uncharacterized protein LOC126465926 [Schistocerca serialis cubense]
MSHQVTITRTTTTTTTSAILINTGYMRSWSGLLKLCQTILGAVCLGIVAYYADQVGVVYTRNAQFFFILMTTTFLTATFCLLLACVLSLSAGTVISKTLYELIYHSIAFILYLAASLRLIIQISDHKRSYSYDGHMAASVIGLVNTALYLLSAVFSYRSYRLP